MNVFFFSHRRAEGFNGAGGVEAGDDGGGGKGRLAGLFGVDWGFYGAVADADEEVVRGGGGYLGIVVRERERVVEGLGEGKWIALMDMVGR